MARETGEDRAKALLRRNFGREIYWIEPGLGATHGMPDCLRNMGGGVVLFIECKEALSDRSFAYKLRPSQARVIPRMRKEGALVLIMVGKPTVPDKFVLVDKDGAERYVFRDDTRERFLEVMKMAAGID